MDIPDDWKPTPENINALPLPLREYIHRLRTETDPAGTVQENIHMREQVEALQAIVAELTAPPPA